MSPTLFLVVLGLMCGQAECLREHLSGEPFPGEHVEIDLEVDDDVLEVTYKKPDNAPDNFREIVSRYVFSRQVVAHKDEEAGVCYLQRSTLTREEVERRLNDVRDNTTSDLAGVEEEWIDPDKGFPVSHDLMRDVFGPEVAEFCQDEAVFYLGSGSYGTPETLTSSGHGLFRPRRAPGDIRGIIVIRRNNVIYVIILREK